MSNALSNYKPIDDTTKPLHITLAVPRILKGDGDSSYTYFQSVCSCGWHGDYKVSKLSAQEDKCPIRRFDSSSLRKLVNDLRDAGAVVEV